VRDVQLEFARSHNRASVFAKWGPTKILATVQGDLIPPPRNPGDGVLTLSVDASPMAQQGFSGNCKVTNAGGGGGGATMATNEQRHLATRVLRILERTILLGGVMDTEALCVVSDKWVWRLRAQVTVLNQGGNVLDAAVLAAMAALRHYRLPGVSSDNADGENTQPVMRHAHDVEPTPLPLHHTPLSISFALVARDNNTTVALVDPTDREELISNGALTLALNKHLELCAMDFCGGCELRPQQLMQCSHLAERTGVELCDMLEKALTDADSKAHATHTTSLDEAQDAAAEEAHALVTSVISSSTATLFDEQPSPQEGQEEEDNMEMTKEEEVYRLNALDYSQMHVAAKVKENEIAVKKTSKKAAPFFGGSLMAAMLKSATTDSPSTSTTETSNNNDISTKSSKMPVKSTAPSGLSNEAQAELTQYVTKVTSKQTKRTTRAKVDDSDSDEEGVTITLENDVAIVSGSNDLPPRKRKKAGR
jgi:exosome complex component RRP45